MHLLQIGCRNAVIAQVQLLAASVQPDEEFLEGFRVDVDWNSAKEM